MGEEGKVLICLEFSSVPSLRKHSSILVENVVLFRLPVFLHPSLHLYAVHLRSV